MHKQAGICYRDGILARSLTDKTWAMPNTTLDAQRLLQQVSNISVSSKIHNFQCDIAKREPMLSLCIENIFLGIFEFGRQFFGTVQAFLQNGAECCM